MDARTRGSAHSHCRCEIGLISQAPKLQPCFGQQSLQMLQKMTGKFYEMAFQDPHLDKFIRSHDDPHGEGLQNGLLKSLEKAHRGLAIGRQGRGQHSTRMATPSTQRRIGQAPTLQHGIRPNAQVKSLETILNSMTVVSGCVSTSLPQER